MKRCYYCDDPLEKKNRSEEHIINQFLGGWLKSYSLLCLECNTQKIKPFDDALSQQLGCYADLIGPKRDREKKATIPLYTKDGRKDFWTSRGNPKYKASIKKKNGEINDFPVEVKSDEEYKEIVGEKLKQLGPNYKARWIEPEEKSYYVKQQRHLTPGEFEIGGIEFYRSIMKIAINYAIYRHVLKTDVYEAIDFLKNKRPQNDLCRFYYPSNYSIYQGVPIEMCHLIYLRGDPEINILYCYLELFSTFNFLIVLNRNYHGKEIEFFDGKDIWKDEQVTKKIVIKLSRQHFLDLLPLTEDPNMIMMRNKKIAQLSSEKLEKLFNA